MLSGQGSWNPDDTIVALATPAAASLRAILRLSGPKSHEIVGHFFSPVPSADPLFPITKRRWVEGEINLADLPGTIAAAVHFWPFGSGYTQQESAEIHLPGSPPLVEWVIEESVRLGARLARPGEFSLRAYLAGQIDLSQAEAIVGLSGARTPVELQFAMERLAGGIRHPVEELRSDLMDLLADLEAGLDFVDEDITFVDSKALLFRLGSSMAKARNLRRRMVEKDANVHRPMVALAGEPNAGKSTLFNRLTNRTSAGAIVSPFPGTTRDWLVAKAKLPGGLEIDWVDTAGLGGAVVDELDGKARDITRQLLPRVDLVVLCVPALVAREHPAKAQASDLLAHLGLPGEIPHLVLWTRCDESQGAPLPQLAVSVLKSQGLVDFQKEVEGFLGTMGADRLPPLARCQAHFEIAESALNRAHESAMHDDPAELVILELRSALDALGEMTGVLHTDDLLDRVFSRFCIGK